MVFGPFYLVWLTVSGGFPGIANRMPPTLPPAKVAVPLIVLPLFAFQIYCLVRFLQKRREVPWLMTVLYGLNILGLLISLIAHLKGYEFSGQGIFTTIATEHPILAIVQIGIGVAFIAYFHDSVRVQNTFVNAAPPKAEPKGLGGWLILPLATVIIILVVTAIAMAMHLPAAMAFAYQHGLWPRLLRQTLVILLAAGYPSLSLYFAFRRKRAARWLLTIYFALWILLGAAILAKETVLNPAGVLMEGLCLASLAYLWLSRRVRNTFIN